MVCFFNEVTVNPDGSGGYTPTIPTPPDPGAPSGPGDDGSSDPGGGSSPDPTDCSGSLQGPTPESTAAYPASGDVPTWLIPQPDADPASGSDLLDPDYPDDPTPAEPPADCDDDETSEDEPEDEEDDVTPCSEVEFDDDDLQEKMEALEEEILNDAWEDSNPDADDQGDRQEQFYWIIEEDGEFSFKSASETSDVTYYPTSVSGVSPSDKPENAVGAFHTHPFEDDEVLTSEEIIERRVSEERIEKYGMDTITDPNTKPNTSYGNGPSGGDYINSYLLGDDLTHLIIDEDGVYEYQYDGEIDMDEPELDDEDKSSTDYERCGY